MVPLRPLCLAAAAPSEQKEILKEGRALLSRVSEGEFTVCLVDLAEVDVLVEVELVLELGLELTAAGKLRPRARLQQGEGAAAGAEAVALRADVVLPVLGHGAVLHLGVVLSELGYGTVAVVRRD